MPENPPDPQEDARIAEEIAVRRLLAEVRHTDPVPENVATRLDTVLAGLATDRSAGALDTPVRPTGGATGGATGGGTGVVVPLSSKRRRWAAAGLVAAAAVVVGGVALPNMVRSGEDTASDAGAGSAGESSDEPTLAETSPESRALEPGPPSDARSDAESGSGGSAPAAPSSVATVRPDRFRQDARVARQEARTAFDAPPLPCGAVPLDGQAAVAVQYAEREGYLVFGGAAADRQRVELYLCPGGRLERRALIPSPR